MENYKLYEPRFRTVEIFRLVFNCLLLTAFLMAFFMPIFLSSDAFWFAYSYSIFDGCVTIFDVDGPAIILGLLLLACWVAGFILSIVDIIKNIIHVSNISNTALLSYGLMKDQKRTVFSSGMFCYVLGVIYAIMYLMSDSINIYPLIPIGMLLVGCIVIYIIGRVKEHGLMMDIIRSMEENAQENLNSDLRPMQ